MSDAYTLPDDLTPDEAATLAKFRPRNRAAIRRLYARDREDATLAAAYDEAVKVHGYPNALDEVAEAFTREWKRPVTASRVRVARWGK